MPQHGRKGFFGPRSRVITPRDASISFMGTRRIALPAAIAASLVVAGCGSSGGTARHASFARDSTPTISGLVRSDTATVRGRRRRFAPIFWCWHLKQLRPHPGPGPRLSARVRRADAQQRTVTASPAWALPACSDATFVAQRATTIYRLGCPPPTWAARCAVTLRPEAHHPAYQATGCHRCPHRGAYTVSVVASSIQLQHGARARAVGPRARPCR